MREYIIYKAENIDNGFVYIGATTRCIEERIKDHIQKANNDVGHLFQEAIGTFGPEAFTWEQIDTAENINELAKMEKEYILEYNSKEEGYNQDSGGGFKKTVYQYDISSGILISEFESLDVAAKSICSTKQHISRAALSVNNIYRGYYWSYDLAYKFTPNKDKRRKYVEQLGFEGETINLFHSVAEASIQTGINKSSIAKCCRNVQKSSGGYIWKYNS